MNPIRRGWLQRPYSWMLALGLFSAGIAAWYLWTHDADRYEQAAITAIQRGDAAAAEKSLLKLHGLRPRDPDVLELLSGITVQRGDYDASLRWMEQRAGLVADPANAYVEAGLQAFEWNRAAMAERCYRAAIAVRPKSIHPWSLLVRLNLVCQRSVALHGNLSNADAEEVGLEQDPHMLWLWVVGDTRTWQTNDAEQWLTAAVQVAPDDAWLQAALAQTYLQTGRPALAQPLFDKLDQPNRWPLRLVAARAALEAGESARAAVLVRGLPSESDSDARSWLLRGDLLAAQETHELALAMFDQALITDPLRTASAQGRARELVKLQRPAEADIEFRRITQISQLHLVCMKLLQQTKPVTDDALAAAALGFELGQMRWAELVCRQIDRQSRSMELPSALVEWRRRINPDERLAAPVGTSVERRAAVARFDSFDWNFDQEQRRQ